MTKNIGLYCARNKAPGAVARVYRILSVAILFLLLGTAVKSHGQTTAGTDTARHTPSLYKLRQRYQQKHDTLRQRFDARIRTRGDSLKQRLGLDSLNLPGLSLPKPLNLPELPKLPTAESQELFQKAQDVATKVTDVPSSIGELPADDLVQKTGIPSAEGLPKVPDVEHVDATVEEAAGNVDEVAALKENTGVFDQKLEEYETMRQRYSDPTVVSKELKRKLEKMAGDKILQSTPAVKDLQAHMAAGKRLTKEARREARLERLKALREKPLSKRVTPGMQFQITGRQSTVDLGVHAAYALFPAASVGGGLLYRFAVNKRYDVYAVGTNVYGGRLFCTVPFKKSLFMQFNGEVLDFTYNRFGREEVGHSSVVVSVNTGIGRYYNITRRIRGSVIALYKFNLYREEPNQSKINIRMGFDLREKKRHAKKA